jgi:hypothetical protein
LTSKKENAKTDDDEVQEEDSTFYVPSVENNDGGPASVPTNVDDMVKRKNLEEMGNFIIEGHGQLLVGAKSDDEQIQDFINHMPVYLVSKFWLGDDLRKLFF